MKLPMQFCLCCMLAAGASAAVHSGVAVAPHHGTNHRESVRTPGYGRYGAYGYGYGGFYGDSFGPSYDSGFYPDQEPAAPGVRIIYPSFGSPAPEPPVHPVIHEYGPPAEQPAQAETPNGPILYLIAFNDNTIRAAMTYWVEAGTLHYLDKDHKQKQAPLGSVDRDLSAQLNRERHVPFSIQ